jgi:hypothetical protein
VFTSAFARPEPPVEDYGVLTGFSWESNKLLWYPEFGNLDQNFTIEFFFKWIDLPNWDYFFNLKSGVKEIEILMVGNIVSVEGSGLYEGFASTSSDTWYHVALTKNGSNWYASLNGNTITIDTNDLITFNNASLCIGSYSLGYSGVFQGSISNFRISNYARYTDNYTIPSVPMTPAATDLLLLLAKPGAPFADSALAPRIPKVSDFQCEWAPGPIQFSNP